MNNTELKEDVQAKTEDYNQSYCKEILSELKKYVEGRLYKCSKCDEVFQDNETFCQGCKKEINLIGYKNEEKGTIELDEQLTLSDFFNDQGIFQTEYRLDGNKKYKSISLQITCGNPNIFIDTKDQKIKLYTWSDYSECSIPDDICKALDEFGKELYNC